MADQVDVLLQMWSGSWSQIRQSENQRSAASNMLIAIASAGIAFIAQQGLKLTMLIVTIPLTALGSFGALLSLKYYERYRYHAAEAAALRQSLDSHFPEARILEGRTAVLESQLREFPRIFKIPLYRLWIS